MENEIIFEFTLNFEDSSDSFEETQSKEIQQAAHSAICRIINASSYFIPEPAYLAEVPIEQEPKNESQIF